MVGDIVHDLVDAGVIAGAEGAEQDVVLAGAVQHGIRVGLHRRQVPLPVGPVDHARLTEAAAPDAAPLEFHSHPVLGHRDKGNQGLRRIGRLCGIIQGRRHLLADAAGNRRLRRCFGFFFPDRLKIINRPKGRNRPVLPVTDLIQGRHIDARHPGRCPQEGLPALSPLLHVTVEIQQFVVGCLSLPDIEEVKKASDRLRVVGAGPAPDHDRVAVGPVRRMKRDPGQVQHLQDVGIAELKLERKAQEIKDPHRILGFQGKQRDVVVPQQPVHIRPGRKNALTPGVLPPVEQLIQDLDPQVGHADLIHIRKAHGKADRDLPVLVDRVHFISQIPRGLLHLQQQLVRQCQFSHTLSFPFHHPPESSPLKNSVLAIVTKKRKT